MTAKRILDLIGAVTGLIMFSPVMAMVGMLVLANLGQPVLFRQQRPGLGGKPFQLIKFRTMRIDPDAGTGIDSDAYRLTRLGRFLRAASLDELPGLWNVLRGDMSLVGPRPLLMQYLDRYTTQQMRRHEVRPGLTGWAQINGRNALSWEDKFALDVWYVDHRSFLLDLRIILITIWQVVWPRGISANGEATMPEFMGSPPGHP